MRPTRVVALVVLLAAGTTAAVLLTNGDGPRGEGEASLRALLPSSAGAGWREGAREVNGDLSARK